RRLDTSRTLWRRPRCRSASTSSTRRPSWASTTARLTAVEDLPSSGTTDVIATMRTPPARENRSAVRNARYASAIAERGARGGRGGGEVGEEVDGRAGRTARGAGGRLLPLEAVRLGHAHQRNRAEIRQLQIRLDLVGGPQAAVQIRQQEREREAAAEAQDERDGQVLRRGRTEGPARGKGLIDHADVDELRLAKP